MKELFFIIGLIVLVTIVVSFLFAVDNRHSASNSTDGAWGIVSYNGHTYVKLADGYGKAIAHNPDCECKEEK